MARVTITYFKTTGKYYSEGYIDAVSTFFDDDYTVDDHIKKLRKRGERPGLTNSKDCEFIWLVEYEDYPPKLWFPKHTKVVKK